MNRRQRERRKRRIIAYTVRTLCVLVLAGMVFLMGCGCLYIKEHFFQAKKEETTKEDSDKNNSGQDNSDKQGDDTQTNGDQDEDSVNTSSDNVTPFTYPDATGLTIVLDAGHGGGDGGTIGLIDENVIEKDINLSVVTKMKALLEECGATVILTRDSDEFLELSDRSYISNRTGADLFVSIHCNSYEDDLSIGGLECYYHKNSDTSKGYAESLVEIAERIGNVEVRYAMEQNYQVLRDSSIPAILVEMGYLSNTQDCMNLANTKYQDTMAQTLVESIVEILKN